MRLKRYRLFISHAWKYNSGYYRLVKMLSGAKYFSWTNYSVPEHDPLPTAGKDRELKRELKNQIRPVQAVIVLAGMYVNHRRWIQEEINIAREMRKPIIAIRPWGSRRTPASVREAAREVVGWNTTSIVKAIRNWAL